MKAAAVLAALLSTVAAAQRPAGGTGRIAPPPGVDCPRDQLTAYTGAVTRLIRGRDRTLLEIRTDWDTTEQAAVAHPGTDDPTRWFLLKAQPFGPEGWKSIESAPGRLRTGVRATAWICEDGRNPIVDWRPATEPPPRGRQ